MTISIDAYWKQFITEKCHTISKSYHCEFCVGSDSLVIDCDRVKTAENSHEPINDCIVFEKDGLLYVAIVEIKGKHQQIDHTLKQLDSGKNIALRIIKDSNMNENYKMYKVIVAKSYPHSAAAVIKYAKRKLLKSDAPLKTVSCNETFSHARSKKL